MGPIVVALAFITAATFLFIMSLLITRMLAGVPAIAEDKGPLTGNGGGAFVPTPTTVAVGPATPTPIPDDRLDALLTQVAGMALTPEQGGPTATFTPSPTPTVTPTLAPGQTPPPAATPTPTLQPGQPTSTPTPTPTPGQPTATPTQPGPTATPTPTRTPTPVPTRTSVPILTLTGGGVVVTQQFEIVSKTWIVEWSTTASQSTYPLHIVLLDPRKLESQREVLDLVNEDVGGNGVLRGAVVVPAQFGPGTYYLKVFGPPPYDGGWRIVVRENQ